MELDATIFIKRIKLYDEKVRKAAKAGMLDNVQDLERKSKELAPLHKGDLTRSGSSRVVMRRDSIEGQVGFNEPYAVKVHEDMPPAPGATMRRGTGTQAKPGNEFGEAGGKYLQRPLRGKTKQYTQHIANKIRAVH